MARSVTHFGAWGIVLGLAVTTAPARADWDFREALRAFAGRPELPRAFRSGQQPELALVLEERDAARVPPGAVAINDGFYTLSVTDARARELFGAGSLPRAYWSPPRKLLLDRADGWTRASAMRQKSGTTGRGVVVGIVDSGVDVAHPDLRNQDGSTRVRWLIDFTRAPLGRHPELEREYGCADASSKCAVYSASDIDEFGANASAGDEPRDNFGHGTHVASLAAGNGLANAPATYVGVAPEADLVIGRVVQGSAAGILDADILRAARFVFDRARDAGAPAVLNLSLGSDFGAHDGDSALERALASFVGPDQPGRAIVVAAGNSAGLYAGAERGVQGPFGVHTQVHVPPESPVTVPVLMLKSEDSPTRAAIYVWLRFRPGDAVAIGLERNGELWIPEVAPGHGSATADEDSEAAVLTGLDASQRDAGRAGTSAMVVIDGTWPASTRYALRLAGRGTASLWVQSSGDLDPSVNVGAVFPYASKEGTINVPASAPELIAVGATLNRVAWSDYLGNTVERASNGALDVSPPDSTAYFSSAGPNALGVLKPDITAPGMSVIGAMSALADPRQGTHSGLFANDGRCEGAEQCLVVDDWHAVSTGTSMASPIVAGAVALLLERDPGLTQERIRALLQAGARPLEGAVFVEQQAGAGALDLEGTLAAQVAETAPFERVPGQRSWLTLAASHAHPDEDWPLEAYLELRDDTGAIADGFDPRRLAVTVRGGTLAEGPSRLAPGLYRFSVVTPPRSGGTLLVLDATFDGRPFVSRSVPVAVDTGAATGVVTLRGGCALAPDRTVGRTLAGAGALAVLAFRRRARQRRAR